MTGGERKPVLLVGKRRFDNKMTQIGLSVDCRDQLARVRGVARVDELGITTIETECDGWDGVMCDGQGSK